MTILRGLMSLRKFGVQFAVFLSLIIVTMYALSIYLSKYPESLNLRTTYEVDPSTVLPDVVSEMCFTAELPALGGCDGDSENAPTRSSAMVFENGRPLSRAHSPHQDIRELGGGRYSHWNNTLYFSTSDNSDPRINGRTYEIQFPLNETVQSIAHDIFRILSAVGFTAFVLGGLWGIRHGLYKRQKVLALSLHSFLFLLPVLGIVQSSSSHAIFWNRCRVDLAKITSNLQDPINSQQPKDYAYQYPFDVCSGDTVEEPTESLAVLLEDGKPLHGHAMHADIRKIGLGEFSHWNNLLIFSSTDNSDPRTNGRNYEVHIPAFSSGRWRHAFMAMFVAALIFAISLIACKLSHLALHLTVGALIIPLGVIIHLFMETQSELPKGPSNEALLINIWLAFRGIACAAIYVFSVVIAGKRLANLLQAEFQRYSLALFGVIGAAMYGLMFTIMALCHVAYPFLILFLALLPLAIWRTEILTVTQEMKRIILEVWGAGWAARVACLPVIFLVIYVLLNCIGNPDGPNVDTYHIVIPSEILKEHGFNYNPFSYNAGLQYGWHIIGLPAFAAGADRAYFCLSFIAYCAILLLVYEFVRSNTDTDREFKGLLAASAAAYIICAFCRTTLPNNDLPTVMVEFAALLLAIEQFGMQPAGRAALTGLVLGFLISIKITVIPGAALITFFLIVSIPHCQRARALFWAAIAAIPLAIIWPLNTFINSGSPFPQHLMLMRFQGPPLQHFRESQTILNQYFGVWLRANYFRFFTGAMLGFSFMLIGILAGVFLVDRKKRNLVALLVVYAVVRGALLSMHGDVALFHDRYHLVTYLLFGILGVLGWMTVLDKFFAFSNALRKWGLTIPFCVACLPLIHNDLSMRSPGEKHPHVLITYTEESLFDQTKRLLRHFSHPAGGPEMPHAVLFDWINKNLPENVRIAGTLIYTYPSHRPYLQILAVSQDQIDLSLPPESILTKLRQNRVTHLHLCHYNHLPPWVWEVCSKWERNLRRIATLPNVKLIKIVRNGEGEVLDELYELGQVADLSRD